MHYCIVAVCGHERQSDDVYTDDRDGNADESSGYSYLPIYEQVEAGRKKEAGNVGEILTMGLCILALTAVMISYMENVQLIAKKAEVGQLARCYLLKMETVGYLAAQDQTQLTAELEKLGMTGIDYEGSTLNPAGYGNDVVLQIHGRLEETYEIYEKRVSTAKN